MGNWNVNNAGRYNICHISTGFRCDQSNVEYDTWAQRWWEVCDCEERPGPPCDGPSICLGKVFALARATSKKFSAATSSLPVTEPKDKDVDEVSKIAEVYTMQRGMMQGNCARDYSFHCDH